MGALTDRREQILDLLVGYMLHAQDIKNYDEARGFLRRHALPLFDLWKKRVP